MLLKLDSTMTKKEKFWQELGHFVGVINYKSTLLRADLNGHVGQDRDDAGDCRGTHNMEPLTTKEVR